MTTALHIGFGHMVRSGLRGVWFRGELPAGSFVWAANHHSWWDPFLAAVILSQRGQRASLVMLQENLQQYAFARRLGVFGSAEPRRGLSYLADGRVLVIFPEGELRPAGAVGELAPGAAWYARRAAVPLCAVGVRLLLRGHQAPEAYVCGAMVDTSGTVGEVTARLTTSLTQELGGLDQLAATSDPRRPLPGFRMVLRGRRSWDERIDAMARWRLWAR